jgi:tryptophan-rich sensory protein
VKINKYKLKILIVSLVIVYLVAFIGSIFTSQGTDSEWFEQTRPSITPPNYVFPIVWNILFFLIALSLYFAWINSKNNENKRKIMLVFGINFILNILWSVFYFSLRNPLYAFIELILLFISIIFMIYVTASIDKKSSYLLVPYLLWVGFAGILNYLSI